MSDGKILAFYAPYIGAGKSTAAEILEDNKSIVHSFALPLYRYAEYLIVSVSKNKTCEELDGKSLREFLIHFGQAGHEFYPDIWSGATCSATSHSLDEKTA